MSTLRLGLIYGSAREGRFCDKIARWARNEISRQGAFTIDALDPKRLALSLQTGGEEPGTLLPLSQRIDRADAFVVVTPEYNHGYPAALKLLIDSANSEWQAKPVAFVSYGGISGGLRAVEQLRQVFAQLHAVTIRDTVSFANPWHKFDDAGRLIEPAPASRAMAVMLGRLQWWANALREARRGTPYGEAAA